MAEPKFTAEHIRQKAAKLYEHFGVYAAPQYTAILHAYADRVQADAYDALILPNTTEYYREQGRREVYAEIAKLESTQLQTGGSPIYDTSCMFCGGKPYEAVQHAADCLWLRARAAVGHE